ncbi:class I SAM-dependent DNA methyltransferase [Peribacillus deserti]|uniref:SAM-dependent methyltransferase n=1 Tax=Peribacillus deserti TaxID=673318 RepID=A0A2N5M9B0_9BACI|nr:class I SAM-dependent methyltransferase [Peribacillus deserti]PLT30938.1 SAM-dependent methyltransferase [Peribacillus deserti]
MSYGQFAYLYDELMKDVPYAEWVHLFKKQMEKYSISGTKVLDLACGTGEISVRFAREGYEVTGVDLSEEMLAVAHAKTAGEGLSVPFFQQDMTDLNGLGTFEAVTIFCDSLNYLESPEDVKAAFQSVYNHLEAGGLFMFDVHSVYKMEHIFYDATFAQDDEEISFIWNSFPGKEPLSTHHELSFFVLDHASGKYDRFEEVHYQRTFSAETYQAWLQESGFELLDIIFDLDEEQPNDSEAERLLFIARKK